MPAEQFQFSADDAGRHAATVDGVSDAVRQARSAVHEVAMDSQAYGQLCQFLPGLLSPLFALATSALDRSASALGGTAAALRSTAADMTGTDNAAAQRITGAAPPLELPL
ncbi:hypothetical protein [Actinoplanes sp. N902-109]|uniref:hypothetical protein n=1 Tax=Actinoplanes sp. (strain N902-109) TaxID=649831 RepID=UPI0003294FA1|nr:hypothetical protein [Actinoplanes sp. N902-109]AGL15610.1 hypothetical protein L083_2100 [Actinoplanes sp. N902-109]